MTMTTTKPLTIVIVEKGCVLKPYSIKDFNEDELYKKCGFKSKNGFELQKVSPSSAYTWKVNMNGIIYFVCLYGKTSGRENNENKYDFPPPVDKTLFFGNCVLLAKQWKEELEYVNLSVDLWTKMYEKLFGGFENLCDTANADEDEEDELDNIPSNLKTKEGYLKDGFVVSSSDEELEDGDGDEDVDVDEEEEEDVDEDVDGEEVEEEEEPIEQELVEDTPKKKAKAKVSKKQPKVSAKGSNKKRSDKIICESDQEDEEELTVQEYEY
jgi:hypothetical protein